MINPCGFYCEECPHFKDSCQGCKKIAGKPFWIKYYDNQPCPIYTCAEEKNIAHCGYCEQIPCQIWTDLKDPSYSDTEHLEKIKQRTERLKNLVDAL